MEDWDRLRQMFRFLWDKFDMHIEKNTTSKTADSVGLLSKIQQEKYLGSTLLFKTMTCIYSCGVQCLSVECSRSSEFFYILQRCCKH